MACKSSDIRRWLDLLESICDSDKAIEEIEDLEPEGIEEELDEVSGTTPLTLDAMAPKLTPTGVPDHSRTDGQSFAEKNGFLG